MGIGAVITGMALADAGSAPSGGYVSITPVKILNAAAVGAGKIATPVAIGGSTTTPTNSTAVQLNVIVKAAQSGVLKVYPAGDPTAAGAVAIQLSGGTTTTQTIDETVGTKDEVAFQNTTSGSATVTASVTGYSTQITASNIAPDGGVSGEVLSNTGNGVGWQAGSVGVDSGTGLTGGGTIALGGSRTLSVDPSAVQSRVTGTCTGHSAVSSINQDGSVGCQQTGVKTIAGAVTQTGGIAAGSGFTVTHDGPGAYTVSFPAGTFNGPVPLMTITPWGVDGQYVAADVFFVGLPGNGAASFQIRMSDTLGTMTPVDNGFQFIVAQTS
jgi:hypothetical protein